MSSDSRSKINQLLSRWPRGTVATLPWLKSIGVYQQLAYRYQKSCWIESLGRGAFKQIDDSVFWDGALYALQYQLNLPIHVSSLTALSLQGRGQFMPIGDRPRIYLHSQRGSGVPLWFKGTDWNADLKIDYSNAYPDDPKFLNELKINGLFSVKVSSCELAILEYIDGVNDEESFLSAKELMEGMVDLRVDIIQELLEKCSSIKVKRIFLYVSDLLDHPWLSDLDLKKIDLGSGKRVVVKGGSFNNKYEITVPKKLEQATYDKESIF